MADVSRVGVEMYVENKTPGEMEKITKQAEYLIKVMEKLGTPVKISLVNTMTPQMAQAEKTVKESLARIERLERESRASVRRSNRVTFAEQARENQAQADKSLRAWSDLQHKQTQSTLMGATRRRAITRKAANDTAIDTAESLAKTTRLQATEAAKQVEITRVGTARADAIVAGSLQKRQQDATRHGNALATQAQIDTRRVSAASANAAGAASRALGANTRAQQAQVALQRTQMGLQRAQQAAAARQLRARQNDAPLPSLSGLFSIPTAIAAYAGGQAVQAGIVGPIQTADWQAGTRIGVEQMFKNRGLGSAQDATNFFNRSIDFAIATPFKAKESVELSRNLLSYGFKPEEILGTGKGAGGFGLAEIIGNAAAVTGEPGANARIARALGQIKTAGRIDAQDMNQLIDAGLDPWRYVAEAHTREFGAQHGNKPFTVGEMKRLAENNQIDPNFSLREIIKGVARDTAGVGQRRADETLGGVLAQITDIADQRIFARWGEGLRQGFLPVVKDVNQYLTNNQDQLNAFTRTLQRLGTRTATSLGGGISGLLGGVGGIDWTKIEDMGAGEAGRVLGVAMAKGAFKAIGESFSGEGGKSLVSEAYAFGIEWASGMTEGALNSISGKAIGEKLAADINTTLQKGLMGGPLYAFGLNWDPENSPVLRAIGAGPVNRKIESNQGYTSAAIASARFEAERTVLGSDYQGRKGTIAQAIMGAPGRLGTWLGEHNPLAATTASAAELNGSGTAAGAQTQAQSSGNVALAADLKRRGYSMDAIRNICGPIAAQALIASAGVNASVADIAAQSPYFDPSQGVTNATQFLPQALSAYGLQSVELEAAQAQQALQNGKRVAINTSAHYYVAQGYNPATGQYDLGPTGEAMSRLGGSRYMTEDQIKAVSGQLYGYYGVSGGARSGVNGGGSVTGGLTLGSNNPALRARARQIALEHGLDPELFERQIQRESGFDPNRPGGSGEIGLGQLMPGTAAGLGLSGAAAWDPEQNLQGSARYLKSILTAEGGDYERALRGYNAGPGRVDVSRTFPGTNDYVADILGSGRAVGGAVGSQGGPGGGVGGGVVVGPGAVQINVLDPRAIDPAVLSQIGNALVDVIAQKLGGKVDEMANNFGMASAGP